MPLHWSGTPSAKRCDPQIKSINCVDFMRKTFGTSLLSSLCEATAGNECCGKMLQSSSMQLPGHLYRHKTQLDEQVDVVFQVENGQTTFTQLNVLKYSPSSPRCVQAQVLHTLTSALGSFCLVPWTTQSSLWAQRHNWRVFSVVRPNPIFVHPLFPCLNPIFKNGVTFVRRRPLTFQNVRQSLQSVFV